MKTIEAHFDGKVFVPESEVEIPVGHRVSIFIDEEPQETAEFPLQNLARLARALNEKFPPDPDTPRDLAAQHDHYLYGTPKRAENNFPSDP
ncbi:MAG TPA: hypothetical protein VF627_00495 [Abditibacterium sp.]|jgi:hypothetical protein